MTQESTDTNSQFNDDIPDGTYDFQVEKVYAKDIKGKKGYEWHLDYVNAEGVDQSGKVLTWPNQIGPLLKVLGCKETDPGKYQWETELMEGKTFKATIVHEKAKKSDKVYCNIKDFQPSKQTDETPF